MMGGSYLSRANVGKIVSVPIYGRSVTYNPYCLIPEAGGTHSDLVRVYDWEGHPVRSFQLDKAVYVLHADADGRCLYGQATDKESGEALLLRYETPQ